MRLRKTNVEEDGFQMTPMIDIVFQLLIFFMCATTFSNLQSEKDVKLPVADHSQAKETAPNELVVNVRKDGIIVLNQITYAPEELVNVLAENKSQFGKPAITIRADKDVAHGEVLTVLRACAYADIWDISFATFKEEPASTVPGG